MPERKLRDTLDELHEQLAHPEQLDEQAVARLQAAVAEIRDALDARTGDPAPEQRASDNPTLKSELEDAARHFEVTHPTLAELIRRVTNALAQSGI